MADADSAKPGDGAPGGDTSKDVSGKTKPSGDEKEFVPKSQFLAALKSANDKYQALEVRFAELSGRQSASVQKADEPKRYTRTELNAAVEAKTITADQAEEVWAKQIREDVKREVREEVLGATEAKRALERVETDLNEYKQLAPEIMEDGSETRQKVREEFDYLVGTLGEPGAAGDPGTLKTQLKAIRAVLGPIEKLRTAKSARRDTEAHEETSSGGGTQRRSSGPKTAWDGLDQRQKAHYQKMIDQGFYKDKAAVEAELKFTRTPNSRRSGARA